MPKREHASEIEDAATVWAAKAERGLTEPERVALDQWLEGDSRRLGAFVRAQAAWIHAERANALGEMPAADLAPTVEAPMEDAVRSEEHTSELQSLMRISYAVLCLNKTKN